MTSLRTRDIIALGLMTFALFIGAGNIIFPPIVAQQAGEHVWLAAFGFLITAGVDHYCPVSCRRFDPAFKFATGQSSQSDFDRSVLFSGRPFICHSPYRNRFL